MRWTGPHGWRADGETAERPAALRLRGVETAGAWVPCVEGEEEGWFAARVEGDSMMPCFSDGDYVVFSPSRRPRSGMPCLVRFVGTGEPLFALWCADDDGTIRLQPLNPAHRAQRVRPEAIAAVAPAVYKIVKLG